MMMSLPIIFLAIKKEITTLTVSLSSISPTFSKYTILSLFPGLIFIMTSQSPCFHNFASLRNEDEWLLYTAYRA